MKISKLYFVIIASISILIIFSVSYYLTKTKIESFVNKWDNIDIFYYINLDFRTDRKTQILEELNKMDIPEEKINRIDAIYNKDNGHIGCTKSHIKTLELFINSGLDNCIIFEDDFCFIQDKNTTISAINNIFNEKVDFDVCMLGGLIVEENIPTSYTFLEKVNSAQTASGYMVSQKFAKKLLDNYKEGLTKFLETNISSSYAVDQYWKLLQKESNWYIFKPKLGIQKEGYSDIQKGVVCYGV